MLLACVTIYFMGVHLAIPPWNSVMGELVAPDRRGRYFGMRGSVMVASQWLATVVAGIGLHLFQEARHEQAGLWSS